MVIVLVEVEFEEMKVFLDGVASDTSGIKVKVFMGWGIVLLFRSELVFSSEGVIMDVEFFVVVVVEKFKVVVVIDCDSLKIYVFWGDALRLSAFFGEVNDEEECL